MAESFNIKVATLNDSFIVVVGALKRLRKKLIWHKN